MKTKIPISILALFCVILSIQNCKNANSKKGDETSISIVAKDDFSEKDIMSMLKSFYTGYITVNSVFNFKDRTSIDLANHNSDSLIKQYCTSKLINQFVNDSLDYDPYLNAQITDERALEKLTIKKDSILNDIYYVSYTYGNITTIKLSVVKENDSYKIDHIFLGYQK